MSGSLQLGDVEVSALVISSSRGLIDLKNGFVQASLYESIFTPGILCDITVNDTLDQLGAVRLSGDETCDFIFKTLDGVENELRFSVFNLADMVRGLGNKLYTLRCVSEETMRAKTNFIQKSYDTQCHSMVEDVVKNYLFSEKNIVTEETRGTQRIVIPHKNPFDTIRLIRQRSVSIENKSPLYTFFENRVNGRQTFNFVTVEKMFAANTVKSFQQSEATNIDQTARKDNNILSMRIPAQFDSIERIRLGGRRRITTFNFTTWQFETRDVDTSNTNFVTSSSGSMDSNVFRSKYFGAPIPPQALIPVDVSQRPETNIPETTADLDAFVARLAQNSIRIRVPGDMLLTAGQTIQCYIPNQNELSGGREIDPLMSGKFLITRIHHRIGEFTERPRHTSIIEIVKGGYEDGV